MEQFHVKLNNLVLGSIGVEYNYGDYFYKESQIQECLLVMYAEYFETYKNTACQMGFTHYSAYFKVCSYFAGLN